MTGEKEQISADGLVPRRPESAAVNFRAVYTFAAALALLLVAVQPIVGELLRVYRGNRPAEDLSWETVQIGAAAHWIDPPADLAITRAREDLNLHEYAWIDRQKGVVRIPVARAMELMAAQDSAPSSRTIHRARPREDHHVP